MSKRDLLKRVLDGGTPRQAKMTTYKKNVVTDETEFVGEKDVDGEIDITITVHYADPKQLEMQENPRSK